MAVSTCNKMDLRLMFEMPDEALIQFLGDTLNPAVTTRVTYSSISRTVLNTRIELATDDQCLNPRRPSTSESSPNLLVGMVSRVVIGVHITRPGNSNMKPFPRVVGRYCFQILSSYVVMHVFA